jgi:hypothetical protein
MVKGRMEECFGNSQEVYNLVRVGIHMFTILHIILFMHLNGDVEMSLPFYC